MKRTLLLLPLLALATPSQRTLVHAFLLLAREFRFSLGINPISNRHPHLLRPRLRRHPPEGLSENMGDAVFECVV